MTYKNQRHGLTRIFLWLLGGAFSLDLFYDGRPGRAILSWFHWFFSFAFTVGGLALSGGYDASERSSGAVLIFIGVFLLFPTWLITYFKRLFNHLRLFERAEEVTKVSVS